MNPSAGEIIPGAAGISLLGDRKKKRKRQRAKSMSRKIASVQSIKYYLAKYSKKLIILFTARSLPNIFNGNTTM